MEDTEVNIGVQLAGESIKYFILNFLYTAILAIASIMTARLLGPAGYGEYSLSLVIPMTLASIAQFGIFPGLVKYVSSAKIKSPGLINRYFHSALIFTVTVSLVVSGIVFLFADQFALIINRPELSIYIRILAILPIFQLIQMVISNFYIGLGKSSFSGGINLVSSIVKASTMITLIIIGMGVLGAVTGHIMGYVAGGLIGLAYTILYYTRKNNSINDPLNTELPSIKESIKMMIAYGIPIYLSGIIVSLGGQYINAILAWFTSNVEIGGFVAARNLMNLITIFITPISINLFPAFSMIESKDKNLIPIAFSRAIRLSELFILPIIGYLVVYGEDVLRLIYGRSYSFAGIYIVLLSLSFILYPILIVNLGYFNGAGEAKNTFKTNLISFVGILILSPILASTLKIIGIIFVLIITSILSTIYSIKLIENEGLKIELRYSIKMLLLITFISLITYSVKISLPLHYILNLILGGILYLILYLILLVYTGLPQYQDIDFIDRSFKNLPVIGFTTHFLIKTLLTLRRWIKK